jgi:hypothetical protein
MNDELEKALKFRPIREGESERGREGWGVRGRDVVS